MQSYDYKPNAGMMALGIVFFGACAAYGYYDATTEHRALLINGFIYLAPDQATIFRWIIAGLSLAFVLAGLLGLVQAVVGNQQLRLTDDAVVMPKSAFGSASVTIPYRDITSLSLMAVRRQRFLRLKTAGKTYTIAEGRLNRQTFETVCRLVAEGRERAHSRA